jgi:hypothetical protein
MRRDAEVLEAYIAAIRGNGVSNPIYTNTEGYKSELTTVITMSSAPETVAKNGTIFKYSIDVSIVAHKRITNAELLSEVAKYYGLDRGTLLVGVDDTLSSNCENVNVSGTTTDDAGVSYKLASILHTIEI